MQMLRYIESACVCVCVQHKGHTNSHTRIYKLSYRANTKTRVVHICAVCSVEFSASDALYRARRVQIYIYFSIVYATSLCIMLLYPFYILGGGGGAYDANTICAVQHTRYLSHHHK